MDMAGYRVLQHYAEADCRPTAKQVWRAMYDAQVPPPPAPADALIARLNSIVMHQFIVLDREAVAMARDRIAALTAELAEQERTGSDWLRQRDAALDRAEQAEARADALRELLRGEVIHGMTKDPRSYAITHHLCQLCKADWVAGAPETHSTGCLAALDAALKEPKT
jgi:hypothetical protein